MRAWMLLLLCACDPAAVAAEKVSSEQAPSAVPRASASAPEPEPAPTKNAAQAPEVEPIRAPTAWDAPDDQRTQGAEKRRRATVEGLFARAGVAFPPGVLHLRAFKAEDELEVWAASKADEPLTRVARYGICAASGTLGPKRREGDRQVPEGFYRISFFNPKSRFHLSMQVSYPNASDRVLSDPKQPGGEIMIHGACFSVGCLAISDERIEELWVMARNAPLPIEVHIFPARDIDALEGDAELRAFWDNLAEGKRLFERDRRLPAVTVDARGRYLFTPRP